MIHTLLHLRDAPGTREWLAQPGRVHQRLCLMWPDGERDERMLWRSDGLELLVQTHERPPVPARILADWALLEEIPTISEWEPDFREGAAYDFVLRAAPVRGKSGRKVSLRQLEEVGWWVGSRQADWGVHVIRLRVRKLPRIEISRTMRPAVRYPSDISGRLVCRDVERLVRAVTYGVGRGRAFGLGLLLLGAAQ